MDAMSKMVSEVQEAVAYIEEKMPAGRPEDPASVVSALVPLACTLPALLHMAAENRSGGATLTAKQLCEAVGKVLGRCL